MIKDDFYDFILFMIIFGGKGKNIYTIESQNLSSTLLPLQGNIRSPIRENIIEIANSPFVINQSFYLEYKSSENEN